MTIKAKQVEKSWIRLKTEDLASIPTIEGNITGGTVYRYTYVDGTILYNFVPSPYDFQTDAFYSTFNGTSLTNLIKSRS